MSTLSVFMKPSVDQVPNAYYVASSRFKDEDGSPVLWEICCIDADEYSRIRNACISNVPVPGKKNQITQQLDAHTFQAKVCARCTVSPDLNNAELQDSWGVTSPHELLGKMLISGEFDNYVAEVFQVNGFQSADELVDEAKN